MDMSFFKILEYSHNKNTIIKIYIIFIQERKFKVNEFMYLYTYKIKSDVFCSQDL